MKTKLTLSINSEVLEKARRISKARQTTLSEIFETTIGLIENEKAAHFNPKIKALQGILKVSKKKAVKEEYFKSYGQ